MYNNAYISPPQSGIASLVSSPHADSDVMNVKMTPREVAGLQQLAVSHGATEQDLYDPITGQPQFSFLKKILPMVAGAFLGPAGYGLSPFAAAATVGLGYGLIEGDLQKGLMAGLGAYSGANITGAFKAAGTPAGEVPKTGSTVTTEAPPAPKFGAVSAKDNILYGGQAPRGFDVDPNVAKNWAASNTPPAGAAVAQAPSPRSRSGWWKSLVPPISGSCGGGIHSVSPLANLRVFHPWSSSLWWAAHAKVSRSMSV